MNICDQIDVRETIFKIARDGARPHILAGIAKRLRTLQVEIQQTRNPPEHVLVEWAAAVADAATQIDRASE